MSLHRRAVVAGMVGLSAVRAAHAAEKESPIAHGFLAKNEIAKAFEEAPSSELPDVEVLGPAGVMKVRDLIKGRTVLMPLWAEWCAPCLSEIPDFARLQQMYAGPKFAIVPVMTAVQRRWTPDAIKQLLGILHASVFEPLMENKFGNTLFRRMARQGGNVAALPCNLIIAPNGRVVGREIGRLTADDASAGAAPNKTHDPETITRAIAGQAQSIWGKEDGARFAAVMAAGFFD
jgi:thiol-disulfide isomerase/thioredoxin